MKLKEGQQITLVLGYACESDYGSLYHYTIVGQGRTSSSSSLVTLKEATESLEQFTK
jgi:hypothetical protein